MNDRLPLMSAPGIVRRIRDNGIHLIQALNIPVEMEARKLEAIPTNHDNKATTYVLFIFLIIEIMIFG